MLDVNSFLDNLFTSPTDQGNPQAVDAYGKNVAAGMAYAGNHAGNMGMGLMNDYRNVYQPYDRQYMNYVDNIGTDAYRAQQRGMAMTGVQQQGDAQRQQMNRQMAAMGVNPNSGRFAAMNGAMAQQMALNKVTAAMGADRSARDEWAKGLGAINAMGVKSAELGLKNMDAAANFGKVGLVGADMGAAAEDRRTNAGANATSAGAAAMNAGTNATNAGTMATHYANQDALGLGRLAFDRYSFDKNDEFRRTSNSFGNTVANGLTTAAMDYLVKGGFGDIVNTIKNWSPSGYNYSPGDATMPGATLQNQGGLPGLEQYVVADPLDYFHTN